MSHPLPRPRLSTSALVARYLAVRQQSLDLAAPLSEADCQVQSMPDASPTKWHLAHVTWFFETMVLERFEPRFRPFDAAFRVLFNSYYQGVGAQHPRAQRGLISRPGLRTVLAYRAAVDERIASLLQFTPDDEVQALVELGLQHEQQHQELMLTDVKHMLSCNPLAPAYRSGWPLAPVAPIALDWIEQAGGAVEIGHDGSTFAFDNEGPRHRQLLRPYALANRLVTHGDWLAFMRDGGYVEPRWWLAAGWDWARSQCIDAPTYWQRSGEPGSDDWHSFTLHGLAAVDPHTPIAHVNYYEADAYARWAAERLDVPARLPTEAEWEHAAARDAAARIAGGNFVETQALHPMPVARAEPGALQLFGDVWEWTASSYAPYPGYRAWDGAVGEYNGKFMVNQYVLRGGSCATPRSHIRASYRNFFPADARWQFSGLRLARDLGD